MTLQTQDRKKNEAHFNGRGDLIRAQWRAWLSLLKQEHETREHSKLWGTAPELRSMGTHAR
jgi:hypothetical protein